MIGEIPLRYAHASLKGSDFNQKEIEIINEVLKKRRSLLLIGKPGCGKTHMAACIYNNFDSDKVWLDASEYIFEMKRRMTLKTTDAAQILKDGWNMAMYSSLVVLDDLGAEEQTDAAGSILTRILMERYNNKRWTIITTNLDGKALKARYGERIISRIYEDFIVVVMKSRDRRKEKFSEVVEI